MEIWKKMWVGVFFWTQCITYLLTYSGYLMNHNYCTLCEIRNHQNKSCKNKFTCKITKFSGSKKTWVYRKAFSICETHITHALPGAYFSLFWFLLQVPLIIIRIWKLQTIENRWVVTNTLSSWKLVGQCCIAASYWSRVSGGVLGTWTRAGSPKQSIATSTPAKRSALLGTLRYPLGARHTNISDFRVSSDNILYTDGTQLSITISTIMYSYTILETLY